MLNTSGNPLPLLGHTFAGLLCLSQSVAAQNQPGIPPVGTASDRTNSAPQLNGAPVLLTAQADDRPIPFDVEVNGTDAGTWLFIESQGQLYAPRDAFDAWRIQLAPDAPVLAFRGDTYHPLAAVPGFDVKVDFAEQSLQLLFSPQVFSATRLGRPMVRRIVQSKVLPSVFLNYDVNLAITDARDAPVLQDLGALTEIGYSTGFGVLTTSAIGRNLGNERKLGRTSELRRLETTFTRDQPELNRTLRIGDAYTRSSMLGRDVYFGGIQYGTNFALTPGFSSQPLPVVTGLSAAPSTVELYVDDVLRQVSSIPTGPFAIENFPTLSGSGNARIVVRDQLGRETIVEQSFVVDSKLLAAGLNDWSIEAGAVRQNLGDANGSYGPEFFSGLWRRGLNDQFTLEGRGEFTSGLSNAQLGAVTVLPWQMLGRLAVAGSSHEDAGSGAQWLFGVEFQRLRSSANLELQGANRNFRQLGQLAGTLPIKNQLAASWTFASDRHGLFGVSFAHISRFENAAIDTMSASYSIRIGTHSNLNVVASRVRGDNGSQNAISMNLLIPLGSRVASAYASNRGSRQDLYMSMTQNPGLNGNLGWRLLAGQQQNQKRAEAGTYYTGRYGSVTQDFSHSRDLTALRLGAVSSVVYADGNLFATRRLDSSFAVAEVEGYRDIGIGLGSNVLARTNSNGVALIPSLSPYQANSVRIDPRELPISAGVESIEQTVVPGYRGAVKVVFPVRSGQGALLRIVLDDGEPAPAGAIIRIVGDDDEEEFYVARRGEAFATGLQQQSIVELNWQGQQCRFEVTLPAMNEDEIARIGPLRCEGVAR